MIFPAGSFLVPALPTVVAQDRSLGWRWPRCGPGTAAPASHTRLDPEPESGPGKLWNFSWKRNWMAPECWCISEMLIFRKKQTPTELNFQQALLTQKSKQRTKNPIFNLHLIIQYFFTWKDVYLLKNRVQHLQPKELRSHEILNIFNVRTENNYEK